MNLDVLRNDRQALLEYVKKGAWFEGMKCISYRLLPLRCWGSRQYLVNLKINLSQEYPRLRVFDVSGLNIALFPDPFLEGRQVGLIAESSGWRNPKILMADGKGLPIASSFICSELTTEVES